MSYRAQETEGSWTTLAGVLLLADGIGGLALAAVVYVAVLLVPETRTVPVDPTPTVLAVGGLLGFGVLALAGAVLVLRGRRGGRPVGIAVGLVAAFAMVALLVLGATLGVLGAYDLLLALAIVAMQAGIVVPLASWNG